KIGPQIGISREPWAKISSSPAMMVRICLLGKTPPFRREIVVRSDGLVLNAGATGPLPLPSSPWQVAQYARNRSGPLSEAINGWRALLCSAFGCPSCGLAALRRTPKSTRATHPTKKFLLLRCRIYPPHRALAGYGAVSVLLSVAS